MKWMYIVAVVAVATGCQKAAVVWQDPQTLMTRVETGSAARSPSIVSSKTDTTEESFEVDPQAKIGPMCPGSLRRTTVIRGAGGSLPTWYMVWWSMRRDSTAVLASSRSDDGRHWQAPVVVDSGDVRPSGCDRPPPSIAGVGDYLYIAYSMQASEGMGVFETHSMDAGRTFHSTVPVMYGDRIVPVALAADGQIVAVAFEEPNGSRHRIGLAISHSEGHLFEGYTIASTDVEPAYSPTVALSGKEVVVSWFSKPGCVSSTCSRVERTGRIT